MIGIDKWIGTKKWVGIAERGTECIRYSLFSYPYSFPIIQTWDLSLVGKRVESPSGEPSCCAAKLEVLLASSNSSAQSGGGCTRGGRASYLLLSRSTMGTRPQLCGAARAGHADAPQGDASEANAHGRISDHAMSRRRFAAPKIHFLFGKSQLRILHRLLFSLLNESPSPGGWVDPWLCQLVR